MMKTHSNSASRLRLTSSPQSHSCKINSGSFPTILFTLANLFLDLPTLLAIQITSQCSYHRSHSTIEIRTGSETSCCIWSPVGPIRSYTMRLQSFVIVHRAISLLSALCWALCSLVLPSLVGYSTGMQIAQLGRLQSRVQVCRVSPQSAQRSTCGRCHCKPAHRDTKMRKQRFTTERRFTAPKRSPIYNVNVNWCPRTAHRLPIRSHITTSEHCSCQRLRDFQPSAPRERPLQLEYRYAQILY